MEVIVLVGIEKTPQMQVAGDDHHAVQVKLQN